MSLEEMVHRFEERLATLGRRLWRPSPESLLREEIETVAQELQEAQAALARTQAEQEMRDRRTQESQSRIAVLTGQIKAYVQRGQSDLAWALALELDRLRQLLVEDRAALPKLSQTCWSLQFRARQIERRLAGLQEKQAGPT
jgi:phage shock protein A